MVISSNNIAIHQHQTNFCNTTPNQKPRWVTTQQIGNTAEDAAMHLHQKAGFEILARNHRFGRYEVDLIARRQNCIHFVEVKARKSIMDANLALNQAQFQRIARVAVDFIQSYPDDNMQIDAMLFDRKMNWERIDNIMLSVPLH